MASKKEDTKFWQQLHNDAIEEPAKEAAEPQKKYWGTVFPVKDFDKVADAKALRQIVMEKDVNEQKLTDILAHRSQNQRMEIAMQYEKDFDDDLIGDLVHALGADNDFGRLVWALMTPPRLYDARCLRGAMEGTGTDESVLIEILCSRTNKQIKKIIEAYSFATNFDLKKDLEQDTGGNLRSLLVAMLETDREDKNVDYTVTLAEASTLIDEELEPTLEKILATRSYAHLRQTFLDYQRLSGHHIMEMISRQTGGFLNPTKDDVKEGYLAIVKCVLSLPGYFAERLYMAMMGFGTDEDTLTRVIVSRSEVDMKKVADIYERRHGKPLGAAIADETSGAYRNMLLALIGQE
ncbi:PREDICTED: annexin A7-like isoform X2 [Branchiostoma belcheri]|uniref:Annexin n=1 Tax=Branchiostoma belcheri TaxID=7741 RepID=A0A6P5A6P1_BRABE|nr:PREDICTED: annexin A7-like isoform X1 [Branchiostoma belcheri]XP_019645173.1 PREDICTED: annexin A7-like isoform X2 [Branchiostoma belcheri]